MAAAGSESILNFEKCKLVLVDVAGTTTSIHFVKDTLLPFVGKHADAYLTKNWEKEALKDAIKQLKDGGIELAAAIELVKDLSEKNEENKGLKTIQGLIYEEGYKSGDLKAHIFEDVSVAFEAWSKDRKIAIYSTGSVASQKLLFAHTEHGGDLSAHISHYFDQEIGSKVAEESYKKIADELKLTTDKVLFITDSFEEARAAKAAGCSGLLVSREGNSEISAEGIKEFPVITSFGEITFEERGACKRRISQDSDAAGTEMPPTKLAKTEENPAETNGEEKKESTTTAGTVEEENNVEMKTDEKDVKEPEKTEDVVEKMDCDEAQPTETTEKEEEKNLTENSKEDKATEIKTEEKSTENTTEEKKPIENSTEEKSTENKTEEKSTENKTEEKSADNTTEEKSTENTIEEKITENKCEEKPAESITEEKPETKKAEEETNKADEKTEENLEEKTEKKDEKVEAEEKESENEVVEEEEKTDEKPINGVEKTEASTPKETEKNIEKENTSVLANGSEKNGKNDEPEDEKTTAVTEEAELKPTESAEIKAKKVEVEGAETKTVALEA